MTDSRADALVFFGATGDLAFKQVFPALQALSAKGQLDLPVVAVGRKEVAIEELRARAKKSIQENGVFDEKAFAKLSDNLRYAMVDYDDASSFESIKKAIGDAKHPLHYVALPPETFESVARDLAKTGLAKGARLALEKPFGANAKTARELNVAIHEFFPEASVFRVDHFLGKEQVENIVYFRAANPLFESAFRRDHISHIEITMAESFGVEGRAKFYDAVGAIRDVVQNHLLQLVACLTMELPTERGHAALRGARSELLAQVRALTPNDIVRGQVNGFREEKDVDPKSCTETFAAIRLFVDAPRWRDVPIHIRTGKAMATTATQVVVHFKSLAAPILEDAAAPAANRLRFALGKEQEIAFDANVKQSGKAMRGEVRPLRFHRAAADDLLAYERLLGDAIDGDLTLFPDEKATFESWRVVEPVLGNATPIHLYAKGSWGPSEVETVAPAGGFAPIA